MPLADLTDYLDDDAAHLSGIPSTAFPDGKTYTFASPDGAKGLRLAALYDLSVRAALGADVSAQIAALGPISGDDVDLEREVMGDTLDELLADGVSWVRIRRLTVYLLRFFVSGPAAADELTAQSGESSARANGATRRAKTSSPTPATSATTPVSPGGSTNRKTARKAKPKP